MQPDLQWFYYQLKLLPSGICICQHQFHRQKRSLVRFSQSKIKIEAIRKPMNCPSRILPLFPSSHPADTITGIIATEYSGHLIAACQRCFLSVVEDFTDKLTRPVRFLLFPLRLGSSSCIGLFMSKGSNCL